MDLDQTSKEIHENAKNKGFYEKYESLYDRLESQTDKDFLRQLWYSNRLMLIVSELGEAMEGLRKNNFDSTPGSGGLHEELSDAMIRLMDFMWSSSDRNPSENIKDKMLYNSKRSFMHGGKQS